MEEVENVEISGEGRCPKTSVMRNTKSGYIPANNKGIYEEEQDSISRSLNSTEEKMGSESKWKESRSTTPGGVYSINIQESKHIPDTLSNRNQNISVKVMPFTPTTALSAFPQKNVKPPSQNITNEFCDLHRSQTESTPNLLIGDGKLIMGDGKEGSFRDCRTFDSTKSSAIHPTQPYILDSINKRPKPLRNNPPKRQIIAAHRRIKSQTDVYIYIYIYIYRDMVDRQIGGRSKGRALGRLQGKFKVPETLLEIRNT